VYTDAIITFILKVSGMIKLKRKEEYFPSPARMKQLKACWMKRINTLKELLDDLDILSVKNTEAYSNIMGLDLAGIVGEVQYPGFISNSILLTRQQFKEHVEILKGILAEKFNSMTEYTEQEIESCFV
jgi:hypothetical protein